MPPAEDEPGRLACADDLSSEEGRLVPAPDPMSQRNALRPPSLRRMIMRTPPVTRLAIVAITVLTTAGSVHLTSRPDRIVSLSPTVTEMLYAIGAGKQVKAVDSYSDYPASAPITKLSSFQPNAEAIAAYQPDLVIISNDINGITAKLKALSIPVLDLPAPANVSGVYDEITQLGAATGHEAQARAEDSAMKADIARIVASEPKHPRPLTYFYELGANPYYSVTDSTFIGSVLSLLGMKSIADSATGAAAAGGYPELSP